MRLRYLPLLMIYFAFGASAFSGIAESFWVKEKLDLSAQALLVLAFWVSLPWTAKMIFGQFADSIPLFGSVRRSYIFLAAGLMATGSILLAGMAGEWAWVIALAPLGTLYLIASLITVIGIVLQDVVADAMSVEVVRREGRTEEEIRKELAAIQLLGRLALSIAIFLVAGIGGWLAQIYSFQTIFLITLVIPLISISGSLLVKLEKTALKPVNWQVLGGGLLFVASIIFMAMANVPYNQEIVFAASMAVVIYLLRAVAKDLPKEALKGMAAAALVIFVFRATPVVGPASQWWQIDVLGFDPAFFGTLAQIGAGLAIAGMWFGAKIITEKPIGLVLAGLTIILFLLNLPLIGMFYGLHEWTQQVFGFGARTIALVDTSFMSPFAQLSMVPMLTLIAIYAPRGNAATWFALMASFMNLALSAANLFGKFLNSIWVVTREVRDAAGNIIVPTDYSQLGELLIVVNILGLILPLVAIWFFLRPKKKLV